MNIHNTDLAVQAENMASLQDQGYNHNSNCSQENQKGLEREVMNQPMNTTLLNKFIDESTSNCLYQKMLNGVQQCCQQSPRQQIDENQYASTIPYVQKDKQCDIITTINEETRRNTVLSQQDQNRITTIDNNININLATVNDLPTKIIIINPKHRKTGTNQRKNKQKENILDNAIISNPYQKVKAVTTNQQENGRPPPYLVNKPQINDEETSKAIMIPQIGQEQQFNKGQPKETNTCESKGRLTLQSLIDVVQITNNAHKKIQQQQHIQTNKDELKSQYNDCYNKSFNQQEAKYGDRQYQDQNIDNSLNNQITNKLINCQDQSMDYPRIQHRQPQSQCQYNIQPACNDQGINKQQSKQKLLQCNDFLTLIESEPISFEDCWQLFRRDRQLSSPSAEVLFKTQNTKSHNNMTCCRFIMKVLFEVQLSLDLEEEKWTIINLSKTFYDEKNCLHNRIVNSILTKLQQEANLSLNYSQAEPSSNTAETTAVHQQWIRLGFCMKDPTKELKQINVFGLIQILAFTNEGSGVLKRFSDIALKGNNSQFKLGQLLLNVSKMCTSLLESGSLNQDINKYRSVIGFMNLLFFAFFCQVMQSCIEKADFKDKQLFETVNQVLHEIIKGPTKAIYKYLARPDQLLKKNQLVYK